MAFSPIPQWISLVSFMPLTIGIAVILRLLHNRSCLALKQWTAAMFQREFTGKDVREQVVLMADKHSLGRKHGNIVIPLWLLEPVVRNGSGGLSLPEACGLFVDTVMQQDEK